MLVFPYVELLDGTEPIFKREDFDMDKTEKFDYLPAVPGPTFKQPEVDENHGKTMGKPWENHRKTIGNGGLPSGKQPHSY